MRIPCAVFLCFLAASCSAYNSAIPDTLLTCQDEPKPGLIARDSDVIDYIEGIRDAGESCRRNLRAVRSLVRK